MKIELMVSAFKHSIEKGQWLYSVLLILSFLFTGLACNKNSPAPDALEGTTWVFKSEAITGCEDPNINDTYDYECTSTDCTTLSFTAGTYTLTELIMGIEQVETGVYVLDGNTLIINGVTVFTFILSDNLLTITGQGYFPGCRMTLILEKQ